MTRRKAPPDVCRTCGHDDHRHYVHCSQGRCVSCRRAPATIGSLCSVCWKRVQREGKEAVDAAIQRLEDGR